MSWFRFPKRRSYYNWSAWGGRFGWWVNIDGHRVADLDYRAFDVDSQFWTTYLLSVVSDRFDEIGFDPDKWCEPNVRIQSRFATEFDQQGVLMSDRGDNLIALRSLYVPENEFEKAVKAAEEWTMEWSDPTKMKNPNS